MTEKQRLQRDRAYFKFVLTGLSKPIQTRSLTEEETISWNTILNLRSELIAAHDRNSRQLGLKVPEHRCWCGKEAKTQIEEFRASSWVCNKHKIIT